MGLGERIFGRRRVLDAWAPVPALALVLGLTSGLRAATWTVCAVGCNDTSIQVAYTGAASGDTIELEGNVQENDSFNRGINITVTSNNGSIWNGAAGSTSPTLSFQNGNGAMVNIDNITMENTSTAGGYVIYYQNNTTYIDMDGVTLDRDSTSTTNNAIIYIAAGDNTDIFNIQQSSLVGDGDDYGLYFGSGNDEAALIENSLLYGFTGGSYAAIYTSRNNTWGGVSIINDTFFNNEYGYFDAGTSANGGSVTVYKNNLFVGDVNDFSLPADLSVGNLATMEATIEYNGFGAQAPNAAYGPGNIYALTSAGEFVSPLTSGAPNLHEIAGAPSICAATGTGAPAVDKDGNPRPTGACYDIGAYQYTGPAASATPSASPTLTPAVTPYPFATLTPQSCCAAGDSWKQATGAVGFPGGDLVESTVYATQDGVNHMWVMGGTNATTAYGDVWRSENGVNWTEVTTTAQFGPRSSGSALNYGGYMWVIAGGTPGTYLNDVWKSADGVNWTQVTANAAFSTRVGLSAVVYDNAMWVIGGYTAGVLGDVWTSTDGANWTEVTANAAFGPRQGQQSQVYNGKMWVIGGNNVATNFNDVWYSTDGATWTEATGNAAFPVRTNFASAVSCNQLWVLGGAGNGTTIYNDVWTSSDGINWTSKTANAEAAGVENESALVFNNTVWSIGGSFGTTFKSWVYQALCDLAVTPTPTPSASPTQAPFVSPTPTPPPLVLTPHYPNPNPAGPAGSWLPYTINAPATVTIRIYDIAGELVRSWDPIAQAAATYECYWNLRNNAGQKTASGVFLVQIDARSPEGVQQEAWEKCAVAR